MAEPSTHSSIVRVPPEKAQPTATAARQPPPVDWVTADRHLGYFVGAVALMERLGNCLGTLAFTWATVVLLGGFSTNLGDDFWYATAIVFLEAFRVFSRESRSDDELLFRSTGSIRLKRMKLARSIPYYLTVAIVIVCMYGTVEFSLIHILRDKPHHLPLKTFQYHILLLSILLALASVAQTPSAADYLKERAWLQFVSALVGVLALGAAMFWSRTSKHEMVLIIPPLLVGCLQSLLKSCNLGSPKLQGQVAWLGTLVALILPAWFVISVLLEFKTMGVLILLGTVLLGNIQIPVAMARIVLSSVRLSTRDSRHNDVDHLAPALTIFYSMVLAQGVLSSAACILESVLSSHYRRSLAMSCGLPYNKGKGYESINLYYEHAYSKRVQDGVLAREDMNLVTFAFNSLDSNSSDKKLAAVQILDSLLDRKDTSNAKLVSEIITSTKVVTSLINMLKWTAWDDEQGKDNRIKLFTVKIIASLAGDLRIAAIPGTVQMISSVLDAKNEKAKQDIENKKLDKNQVDINDNQQQSHAWTNKQELSKQLEGGNKGQRSNVKFKFLKHIKSMLHEGEEENKPIENMNLFPIKGMLILERLAHDLDNCVEISNAVGLIPKITGFITNTTETTNEIVTSSLTLIAKLFNTEGEIGVTIRKKILDQPFLFSNLVEILVGNTTHSKQWKPTMVIITKIILEDETSEDLERFHVIIPMLVHAFLTPAGSSNTNFDPPMRTLAGEALSKLVSKHTSFFMNILQERGYGLIGDLKNMLKQDEYTYVAASLLRSMGAHPREVLQYQRSIEDLTSILQVVLKKILDAEGKQLEVLITTALKLRDLIPKEYARELESHAKKEDSVEKLVTALNSNKKMCEDCPRIRRVIVEVTISIAESCPHYSPIFRSKGMMEALSKLESLLVNVENYKAFLGKSGADFDTGLPPSDLVTRAKRLIGSETPSQEVNVDSPSLDIVLVN